MASQRIIFIYYLLHEVHAIKNGFSTLRDIVHVCTVKLGEFVRLEFFHACSDSAINNPNPNPDRDSASIRPRNATVAC